MNSMRLWNIFWSRPILYESVDSHLRSGLALLAVKTPVPHGVDLEERSAIYAQSARFWLPVEPYPKRSFRLSMTPWVDFINGSLLIFHAKAADGNHPQR